MLARPLAFVVDVLRVLRVRPSRHRLKNEVTSISLLPPVKLCRSLSPVLLWPMDHRAWRW